MPRVSLGKSQEIERREKILYERYGGYMTVASVMAELGCSRPTAMKFLSEIPSYNLTGKRMFDIKDIAVRIESCRIPAGVSR